LDLFIARVEHFHVSLVTAVCYCIELFSFESLSRKTSINNTGTKSAVKIRCLKYQSLNQRYYFEKSFFQSLIGVC
jgi:hypothetical protein